MTALIQDLSYALRQLRRTPGLAVVAILTLALGIGANTAIFSLANAAFFRSLPFPNADRLAFLWQDNSRTGETEGAVSYPNYADWRTESRTIEDMAFISFGKNFLTGGGTMTTLSGPSGPEQVPAATVSTNFFALLGVKPFLGRGFLPDDSAEGHTSVLVISYGLWQERFGGDPRIVGRSVKIWGGNENVIIGVLPRGFTFPNKTQIWKPRAVTAFLQTKARQYPNMAVVGRCKPGVTWQQAQAEMSTIAARLASEYPNIDGGVGIRIVPLRQQLSEKIRQGIVILWGAIVGVSADCMPERGKPLNRPHRGTPEGNRSAAFSGSRLAPFGAPTSHGESHSNLGRRLARGRLGRSGRESGLEAESGYRETQRHRAGHPSVALHGRDHCPHSAAVWRPSCCKRFGGRCELCAQGKRRLRFSRHTCNPQVAYRN